MLSIAYKRSSPTDEIEYAKFPSELWARLFHMLDSFRISLNVNQLIGSLASSGPKFNMRSIVESVELIRTGSPV